MQTDRAALRATTPSWYRWWLHAGLIAVFCATGAVICLVGRGTWRASDIPVFVVMLLLANLGEFAVHVRLLHHPRFPNAAYRRHSAHHSFFSYDAMAIDEARDLRWVLFPPWALPLMVLGLSPVFALLWSFAPTGSGWIFLLAAIVYYGVYEVFHALAHLPAHSFAAGWSWVRAITHHHRVHHDPRWMLRYNFNFAIPIFDWAFGTLASSRRSVRPLAR